MINSNTTEIKGTNIDEALNEYKPELMSAYKDMVNRTFDFLINKFGKNLDGVYNSRSYRMHEKIRSCIVSVHHSERQWEIIAKKINNDKLNEESEKYAEDVIKIWKYKILFKIGQIDNAECTRIDSMGFLITGTKFNKSIRIEQHMKLNISKLGTLFNQFPTLIEYDNKRISEKNFKELMTKEVI